MGLAEVQTALARLYTDAAWRAEFFAAPPRVGATVGLTAAEAQQLTQLQTAEVNFFALTLHGKRLNEIHKLLPLAHRAFGRQFDDYFRAYAETYLPDGTKKHLDDALAFAVFLPAAQTDAPAWARDVLRYETARLIALQPKPCFIARRFRHALKPLLRSLNQAEAAPVVVSQSSGAVWCRPTPDASLRHWLWR